MITGFYAAILAFLFIVLIFNVIAKRLTFKIGIGNGGNHMLEKAIRVHANFAEHVPFAVLLIALCEYGGITAVYLHVMGGLLVLSRVLHAVGMSKTSVRSIGRTVGVLGTACVIVMAAVLLILQYVTA